MVVSIDWSQACLIFCNGNWNNTRIILYKVYCAPTSISWIPPILPAYNDRDTITISLGGGQSLLLRARPEAGNEADHTTALLQPVSGIDRKKIKMKLQSRRRFIRSCFAAADLGFTVMGVMIGLVFLAPQFWCRILCPLGAALSLVARLAPCHRRFGESCIKCDACSAACPPDYGAIELRRTGTGEFLPYVKEQLCTGCGVCEYKCPIEGESAVRVFAVEERISAK